MRTFLLGEAEEIIIGNGIVLRVLKVDGDEVRLEIDRPEDGCVEMNEDQRFLHAVQA